MKKIYQLYKYDYDEFYPLGYYDSEEKALERLRAYIRKHIEKEKNTRAFLYKSYSTKPNQTESDKLMADSIKLKDIKEFWDDTECKLRVIFVGKEENYDLEEKYNIQEIIINQDLN